MNIKSIKHNMNKIVSHRDDRNNKSKYRLTACIFRKNQKTGEFYYQVELQDLTCCNTVVICGLEDIEEEKQ